ncbi:MAG: hypothetical protein HY917_00805 [Candidatus Diapherotrites archaeon]|nr:hypothetical protein [Candidatus Diapherotrites archaeon]
MRKTFNSTFGAYSEGQKELDRHFLNTCRKHSNSAFLGKYLPVSSKN